MLDKMTKRVHVAMTDDTYQYISDKADADRRSVSIYTGIYLEQAIAREKAEAEAQAQATASTD